MLIDIIHDWHQKHHFCNGISASDTIWTAITERTAANLELKDDGSSPWSTHEIRRFHPKDSSESPAPAEKPPRAGKGTADQQNTKPGSSGQHFIMLYT